MCLKINIFSFFFLARERVAAADSRSSGGGKTAPPGARPDQGNPPQRRGAGRPHPHVPRWGQPRGLFAIKDP